MDKDLIVNDNMEEINSGDDILTFDKITIHENYPNSEVVIKGHIKVRELSLVSPFGEDIKPNISGNVFQDTKGFFTISPGSTFMLD